MTQDPKDKEKLSRRQFLTYALGGTGAFMATSIVAPLIPFTTDPLIRRSANAFVEVGNAADISSDLPKKMEFNVQKKDGWMDTEQKLTAWIIRQPNGQLLAMSPICTHLGCLVNGSVDASGKSVPPEDGKWFFHCPCHDSYFDKYGINKPGVPAKRPLDVYTVKEQDGKVSLGPISQRTSS